MTKAEEIFYTLQPYNIIDFETDKEEYEIVERNKKEISESYLKLRGRWSFEGAHRKSTIPVIERIIGRLQ